MTPQESQYEIRIRELRARLEELSTQVAAAETAKIQAEEQERQASRCRGHIEAQVIALEEDLLTKTKAVGAAEWKIRELQQDYDFKKAQFDLKIQRSSDLLNEYQNEQRKWGDIADQIIAARAELRKYQKQASEAHREAVANRVEIEHQKTEMEHHTKRIATDVLAIKDEWRQIEEIKTALKEKEDNLNAYAQQLETHVTSLTHGR